MDALGSKKLLRLPEVLARVGVTARTLRRWYASSKFPQPIFLGNGRIPCWLESDLEHWQQRVERNRRFRYRRVRISRPKKINRTKAKK